MPVLALVLFARLCGFARRRLALGRLPSSFQFFSVMSTP